MKKLKFVLGLFMVMSLLLTACANTSNLNGTDTVDDGVLELTNDNVFGDVGDVDETETMPTEEMAETVIIPETGSSATDQPETKPKKDGDKSQEIPHTGATVDAGRLSNLMDYEIVSMDDEEVGEIDDFVINLDEQKIEYALVNVGGFLGIGAKEVAIPFTQLNLSTMEDDSLFDEGLETVFTFLGDEERFEDAPEFDRDTVPGLENGDMADNDNWDLDFSEFWQDDEDAADDMNNEMDVAANQNLRGVILASDLLGLNILDDNTNNVDTEDVDNDEVIGTLTDVIVNPQSGQIQYLVVELSNMDDMGYRWAPVPLYAPYAPYAYYNDDIALVLPADALENAPVFDRDQFPITTEPGWSQEIDNYWNNQ